MTDQRALNFLKPGATFTLSYQLADRQVSNDNLLKFMETYLNCFTNFDWATDLKAGVRFPAGHDFSLLEPIQPPVQWVTGSFLGGRETRA
jgi:hypothetical protein